MTTELAIVLPIVVLVMFGTLYVGDIWIAVEKTDLALPEMVRARGPQSKQLAHTISSSNAVRAERKSANPTTSLLPHEMAALTKAKVFPSGNALVTRSVKTRTTYRAFYWNADWSRTFTMTFIKR